MMFTLITIAGPTIIVTIITTISINYYYYYYYYYYYHYYRHERRPGHVVRNLEALADYLGANF